MKLLYPNFQDQSVDDRTIIRNIVSSDQEVYRTNVMPFDYHRDDTGEDYNGPFRYCQSDDRYRRLHTNATPVSYVGHGYYFLVYKVNDPRGSFGVDNLLGTLKQHVTGEFTPNNMDILVADTAEAIIPIINILANNRYIFQYYTEARDSEVYGVIAFDYGDKQIIVTPRGQLYARGSNWIYSVAPLSNPNAVCKALTLAEIELVHDKAIAYAPDFNVDAPIITPLEGFERERSIGRVDPEPRSMGYTNQGSWDRFHDLYKANIDAKWLK